MVDLLLLCCLHDAAPIDYCGDMPCENNGTCSVQTEGYLCICDPMNWSGVNCAMPIGTLHAPRREVGEIHTLFQS